MTTYYGSICEWDIGLSGQIYDTLEGLKEDQVIALKQQGVPDEYDVLEAEGLVGFEEITLNIADPAAGKDLFERLREANRARQAVWPGYSGADAPFRTIEFGEEAGELLGAVKKLMRFQRGIAGNVGKTEEDLRMNVLEEIGDVLISLDLMTDELGVDIADCVPMKFNKTSAKVGLNVFMDQNWGTSSGQDSDQMDLFSR